MSYFPKSCVIIKGDLYKAYDAVIGGDDPFDWAKRLGMSLETFRNGLKTYEWAQSLETERLKI